MIRTLKDRFSHLLTASHEYSEQLRARGGGAVECEIGRSDWMAKELRTAKSEFEEEVHDFITTEIERLPPDQQQEFLAAVRRALTSLELKASP